MAIIGLATAGLASTARGAEAKDLWTKQCAQCHGATGKGDTRIGARLGVKDYTDPKVQAEVTDEEAFKAIKEGFKDDKGKVVMKPAEGLSDEEIKSLVAYLRTLKK